MRIFSAAGPFEGTRHFDQRIRVQVSISSALTQNDSCYSIVRITSFDFNPSFFCCMSRHFT
jgi:hypothetical protein